MLMSVRRSSDECFGGGVIGGRGGTWAKRAVDDESAVAMGFCVGYATRQSSVNEATCSSGLLGWDPCSYRAGRFGFDAGICFRGCLCACDALSDLDLDKA